jgi:sigma-B regulation protein RsbU (phosphoserine phosphatase)
MPEIRSNRVLQLRFPARAADLKRTRESVREAMDGCGCSAKSTADIVLAIDEACQNIIRHAYRGDSDNVIELEVEHRGDSLIFSLTDHAPAIDPSQVKPRRSTRARSSRATSRIFDPVDSAPISSAG